MNVKYCKNNFLSVCLYVQISHLIWPVLLLGFKNSVPRVRTELGEMILNMQSLYLGKKFR